MDITLLGPGMVFQFQYRYRMELFLSSSSNLELVFGTRSSSLELSERFFPMHVQADIFYITYYRTVLVRRTSKNHSNSSETVFSELVRSFMS